MEIFRGRNTKPVNRIFILRGASIDRNRGTLNGRKALARYHQSYLQIGREADYNKLLSWLKQPQNQGKTVRGLGYDYVMEVTIRVSGFKRKADVDKECRTSISSFTTRGRNGTHLCFVPAMIV